MNVEIWSDIACPWCAVGKRRFERALEQFEHSLQISPNHPRTLLNKGIVLWRGKQDLKGAAAAWETLVKMAPNSPEGKAAKQGLEAIAAARQDGTTGSTSNQ